MAYYNLWLWDQLKSTVTYIHQVITLWNSKCIALVSFGMLTHFENHFLYFIKKASVLPWGTIIFLLHQKIKNFKKALSSKDTILRHWAIISDVPQTARLRPRVAENYRRPKIPESALEWYILSFSKVLFFFCFFLFFFFTINNIKSNSKHDNN